MSILLYLRTIALIGCILLGVFACAYRPPFKTSVPHTDVDSFRESITLCAEYEIDKAPVKKKHPDSLVPFVRCLQDGLLVHPPKGQPIFQVFFEEINNLLEEIDGETFTRQKGLQIEMAIQSAFKGLWQEGLPTQPQYTQWERENLFQVFPRTAQLLGARQWVTRLEVLPADARLERLKGNIADLASGEYLSKIPREKISGEWCRRFRKLQDEVVALSIDRRNFLDDRLLLLAKERNSIETVWRNRYEKRLQAAQDEVIAIREADVYVFMCARRSFQSEREE